MSSCPFQECLAIGLTSIVMHMKRVHHLSPTKCYARKNLGWLIDLKEDQDQKEGGGRRYARVLQLENNKHFLVVMQSIGRASDWELRVFQLDSVCANKWFVQVGYDGVKPKMIGVGSSPFYIPKSIIANLKPSKYTPKCRTFCLSLRFDSLSYFFSQLL